MDKFFPSGDTVTVGTTAVQVTSNNNTYETTYRIRNTHNTDNYITWGNSQNITIGNPSTVPAGNTIGVEPNSVEFITLPNNSYFIAKFDKSFEVTPGSGG